MKLFININIIMDGSVTRSGDNLCIRYKEKQVNNFSIISVYIREKPEKTGIEFIKDKKWSIQVQNMFDRLTDKIKPQRNHYNSCVLPNNRRE